MVRGTCVMRTVICERGYMIAKILLFYNRYLNSVAVNNKQVSTDYMRETMLYQEKVKVTQSCPTLCETMDYTVHGILQARMLEWVAVSFSRGSSQPRDQTQVSRIAAADAKSFQSCPPALQVDSFIS